MYRLMIVEDEPIERQGIHLMLANGFPTLSDICEAEDGYEAVRLCREFQPHIVMIDLHMPGMSGLETIVELRRIDAGIRFIILTSHDKFAYAHEAIRLGVEDYILKPAGVARLRDSIASVVDKLEHDKAESSQKTALLKRMESLRPILERDCVHSLVSARGAPPTAEDFRFLDFAVNGGFCFVIGCDGLVQGWLAEVKQALGSIGVHCVGEEIDRRAVFFALYETPPDAAFARQLVKYAWQQATEKRPSPGAHAGVSGVAAELAAMRGLYAQATAALREAEALGRPLCLFSGGEEAQRQSVEIGQAVTELQHAMTTRDALQQKVAALAALTVNGQPLPAAARWALGVAERFAAWLQENGHGRPSGDAADPQALLAAKNAAELTAAFQAVMQDLTQGYWREGDPYSQTLVGKVLFYIEQNYGKNLSLDSIAEQFSITPFYLSRLIKKKIGKSFPDLLADCRIRHAKELLRQNRSIKEVTYEVGFSSQNYFGKTFKKVTGQTPTEYRERYCR